MVRVASISRNDHGMTSDWFALLLMKPPFVTVWSVEPMIFRRNASIQLWGMEPNPLVLERASDRPATLGSVRENGLGTPGPALTPFFSLC